MKSLRKINELFHITVEGQCEELYFRHLEKLINESDAFKRKVQFKIKQTSSVVAYVKSAKSDCRAYVHIQDIEDFESGRNQFEELISQIREAEKIVHKDYMIGYSNFTFELWILLHKGDLFRQLTHRDGYLREINKVYNTHFEGCGEYKEKENFKRILKEIALDDVFSAIIRAEMIRNQNRENKEVINYKNFCYYRDNPDLTVHDVVKLILKTCARKPLEVFMKDLKRL